MNEPGRPGRRLHIGGWEVRAGWEILDAVARDGVDHVGDAADLTRFPDGTFVEIYASHVVEHFDFKAELPAVLREWRRVMQPGATLCVSVPDLERLCHLYLTPKLAPEGRLAIMRMMFGSHVDGWDYHMVGLDEHYLGSLLEEAGFTGIQRVAAFSHFRDTSSMLMLGVPISLNMTATR